MKIFIIYVSLDKKVSAEFWKSPGSEVRSPDKFRYSGCLHCPSAFGTDIIMTHHHHHHQSIGSMPVGVQCTL